MKSLFIDGFVNPYNQTPRDKKYDYDDKDNVLEGEYYMEDEFCFYESSTDDITFVQADEKERPDLISYRMYGNPLYDWVIMRRNAIQHPTEIVQGMMLFIPKFSNVITIGSPLIP